MRKIHIVINHSELQKAEKLAKDQLSDFDVSFSHKVLHAAHRVKTERFTRGDGVIHVTGTAHAVNHQLGEEQSQKYLRDAVTGQGGLYHICRFSVLEATMLTLKGELNTIAPPAAVTA